MTNAQKHNREFETVAKNVIQYLLRESENVKEIKETSDRKDGGYDIVVDCSDGNATKRLFFECKLRSGNLNLRDIAANLVIAFNEGAICFVAMTNYDYTPQLEEHFHSFYRKTVLNIKIIIGAEIKQVIEKHDISATDELLSILTPKRTRRKEGLSLLRLDFGKDKLFEQLLYKLPIEETPSCGFIVQQFSKELNAAIRCVERGETLSVMGYTGVGKSRFIFAVLRSIPFRPIYVDAILYETQEHLLISLLKEIWGLPDDFFLDEFTPEHIQRISASLGEATNDKKTEKLITDLLNGITDGASHDITYIFLACRYILSLLKLHKNDTKYVFCINNFRFANNDVAKLLVYLIKLLHNDRFPCIIEDHKGEYALQQGHTEGSELIALTRYHIIEIEILSTEQAINYVTHKHPLIPIDTARTIVDAVGTRLYNLSLALDYLTRDGIGFEDIRRITHEVTALTPNDIPSLVNKFFPFYRLQNRSLFSLIALLHGKVPYALLNALELDGDGLESLLQEQLLYYAQGYVLPSNAFVNHEILHTMNRNDPRLDELAEKTLVATENEAKRYSEIRIYLLYYTGKYELALELLDTQIEILKRQRQYAALIQQFDLAIDICEKMGSNIKKINYLIEQLYVIVVKKEIAGQKARTQLDKLHQLLSAIRMGRASEVYQLAYDYFVGKRAFKRGDFTLSEINHKHYQRCIAGEYTDNTGDWLGRICCNYALFVKETQGSAPALEVFQRAIAVLPDSFELQREYDSHLACMCLYGSPNKAYEYYKRILQRFEAYTEFCALPFHEHGDIAMSLLLSGDAKQCDIKAQEAITLATSHGVWDEVGRIMNIKGCGLLFMEKTSNEVCQCFRESTAIMERTGYKLYCWRSRLNQVQVELMSVDHPEYLTSFLKETYMDFTSLLGRKLRDMLAHMGPEIMQTREYHALLVFGRCFRYLGIDDACRVAEDFSFGPLDNVYAHQVEELVQNPQSVVIPNSPYFHNGIIFMVG